MFLSRSTALALLTLSIPLLATAAGRSTKVKEVPTQAKSEAKTLASGVLANLPLYFEANRGQTDASVSYLANMGGTRLFLTRDSAVFALPHKRVSTKLEEQPEETIVRMRTVNSQRGLDEGMERLPGVSNYFIGNDSAKWVKDVPQYARVKRQGVYPGVDMVFYGNQRQFEYDFVVAPGADPSRIELAFDGVDGIHTNSAGDLVLATAAGEFLQKKPKVYQQIGGRQVEVASHYRVGANQDVHFEVARYDRRQALVIDPTIQFNAVVGGSTDENLNGAGIAVDSSQNVYVVGSALGPDFPLASPLQSTFKGARKIVIFKLNSSGSTLLFSTYLGGEVNDYGSGVAIDSSGSVFVVGLTFSSQFPVVAAAQTSLAGSSDGTLSKLSASGGALLYSTYVGGPNSDELVGLAVDSNGSAYVAGAAQAGFPTTSGSVQSSYGGGIVDCVVAKYNSSGAKVYSTYLGGSDLDRCTAVAVNSSGEAYVTGYTQSTNFPVTPGAYQPAIGSFVDSAGLASTADVFVTKLNAAGNQALFSTYLGGRDDDVATAIAVDSLGAAYITGFTNSKNLPTSSGAYKTSAGNPSTNVSSAFVAKFASAGALNYSTYLAGSSGERGNGIAVDNFGNAYVSGLTISGDFPLLNPVVATFPAPTAGFVTELTGAGTGLIFSTYLGGPNGAHGSLASSIAVDTSGNAYILGLTDSQFWKNTAGALYSAYGGLDFFITKMSVSTGPCVVSLPSSTLFAFGSGATFNMEVFAPSGCAWTATSAGNPWITFSSILSSASGTGTAGASISVAANSGVARTATVAFSTGQSIVITQGPGGCSYAFSTTTGTVVAGGGSGSAPLTAGAGCTWNAVSSEPWLTLSTTSGSGNGSIAYSATANPNAVSRTGTITVGTAVYTITQSAPATGTGPATVISSNPAGGSGSSQIFTFTFASPDGYQNLTVVDALINNYLDGRSACYVALVPSGPSSSAVYLVNDAGAAGGPYASMTIPGTGTVSNGQCTISGSGSSIVGSGTTLTANLNISFKSSFAGNKVLYLAAQNGVGNSDWQAAGTWNAPGITPSGPYVVSASPSHSNATSGTYTFTFASTLGVSNLNVVNILINKFIDGRSACYVAFAPSTTTSGTLYLVNNAGDAGGPYATMSIPSTATVSNSQCTINAAGSSISASGNTLVVTLNMTFTGFSGNRVMYLAARNQTTSSDWQAVGSLTLP